MNSIVKKADKGFTLMELMVVVAIIGILAAVAVPTYQGYITAAKHAACKMEAAGAFKAYLAYKESPDVLKGPDGITDPRTQSSSTDGGGNTVTTYNIAIDGEYYTYTSNNPNCNGTATIPTKAGVSHFEKLNLGKSELFC